MRNLAVGESEGTIPESIIPGGSALDSNKALRMMVVVGEASSDEHAAAVVTALREQNSQLEFFGMGGSHCRAAGVDILVDIDSAASVMGVTEVFGSLGALWKSFAILRDAAVQRKADLVMLVDFPEFNMLLGRALKKRGLKLFYFISPQIWAWRKGRVKTIKRLVERVATIFPFEEHFYHRHGVEAEYVGHPYLDRPPLVINRDRFLAERNISPRRPVIALLPGSRKAEVERLLPPMLAALKRIRKARPGVQAVLPVAPTLDQEWIRGMLGDDSGVVLTKGEAREVLSVADSAVVASGTATVEAALAGVPFVVAYIVSPITYFLGRLLIRGVKRVAMANLIAERDVVPELLQHEATPERIAEELERLLGSEREREKMRNGLKLVRKRLQVRDENGETAAMRVGRIALSIMTAIKDAGSKRKRYVTPRRERSAV